MSKLSWKYSPEGAFSASQGWGPKVGTMLEDFSFPITGGKDPARDKVVASAIKGKKVLSGPSQSPGVGKDSFNEVENGIKYVAKRETAGAYYVVKPPKWDGPVPEGVQADSLCELHWVYLMRWTAGGPKRRIGLNKWYIETDHHTYPILCKNAKRISKIK